MALNVTEAKELLRLLAKCSKVQLKELLYKCKNCGYRREIIRGGDDRK